MTSRAEAIKQYVPLTCHGHSRPVTHISFSSIVSADKEDEYYLISACKDNNPMLRDGVTGDWIGTFFGHKGAVYQARLAPDAKTAATASADFTARIWDTFTGETLYTLQHKHVVRALAFPPESGTLLATGGVDKRLVLFDLDSVAVSPGASSNGVSTPTTNGNGSSSNTNTTNTTTTTTTPAISEGVVVPADKGFEIGAGVHQGAIKNVIWTRDPNILVTAADDKVIRWWDLRTRSVVQEQTFTGDIGSCEFTNVKPEPDDIGHGLPVLVIAAGTTVYFYGGASAQTLLHKINLGYDVASAALHPSQGKLVVGGIKDTWAKVYDYATEQEIDVHKGHHGPIWSISFSPDGKLYATGSEDGTIKMWKNCQGGFGLWKAERE